MKVKIIFSILILLLLFIPFGYVIYIYADSYDQLKNLKEYKPQLATKIFDRNGKLISELFEEKRDYVKINKIPVNVKQAFLAAEDKNFYKHTGIDIIGIVRAIIVDLVSGRMKQGGSTITQQLAKQLYTNRSRTIRRKVVELLFAFELEKKYSKNKILEMYLNQIYFGHGLYGIESAARFYLKKTVNDITPIEAALLASIPTAPNKYSPIRNPRRAYERHKKIIYNMINEGYIDKTTASQKFNTFWMKILPDFAVRFASKGVMYKNFDNAPHVTEYIRRLLVKQLGKNKVYNGGLKIYTTIDLRYQRYAQKILKEDLLVHNKKAAPFNRYKLAHLDWYLIHKKLTFKQKRVYWNFLKYFRTSLLNEVLLFSSLFSHDEMLSAVHSYLKNYEKLSSLSRVEGALVSLNPFSGEILSMVGGSEFSADNQLNRAVQARRQPGSAFKAFVYGAGIESGLVTSATAFLDAPVIFKGGRKNWTPSNYGRTYRGIVLTRDAFVISLNIVSALIYDKIGGPRIANFASRLMNIPYKRFEIDPTLALGTTEVTPLEITQGFGAFANGGFTVMPFMIKRIVNNRGKEIYSIKKNKKRYYKRVMTRDVAFLMTSLMRGVVDYGTAYLGVKKAAGFWQSSAGKTGTTSVFRDAWYVGYTPDMVTTVWVGCDSQKFTLGPGQAGPTVAAPIWGKYMAAVYKHRKKSWFSGVPLGIVKRKICTKSGKLPSDTCKVKYEYFKAGTEPKIKCNGNHKSLSGITKMTESMKSIFDKKSKELNILKDFKLPNDSEKSD